MDKIYISLRIPLMNAGAGCLGISKPMMKHMKP